MNNVFNKRSKTPILKTVPWRSGYDNLPQMVVIDVSKIKEE